MKKLPSIILSTFLGKRMAQTRYFIPFFEELLFEDKYSEFKRIIEIGTAAGQLSLYFQFLCQQCNAEFHTYDNVDRTDHCDFRNNVGFYDCFHLISCWDDEENIKEKISDQGRSIIFCDGGNKIKEFKVFSDAMKVGDIIGAHDWDQEIDLASISGAISRNNLKMIGEDHPFMEPSATRFFIKE